MAEIQTLIFWNKHVHIEISVIMCNVCYKGKTTRNVILITEKRQAEKGNVIPKKTKIEQG